MPVTDPIADMLTRIRNANAAGKEEVAIPTSRLKVGIAKILREEGFIKHYKVSRVRPKGEGAKKKSAEKEGREGRSEIRVFLKFGPNEERILSGLERLSRPGLRRYVKHHEIPMIQGGLGLTILSTSKGLMTGKACRQQKIGGELLCAIW